VSSPENGKAAGAAALELQMCGWLPHAVACGHLHARGRATAQARRHHGRHHPRRSCLDQSRLRSWKPAVLQVQRGYPPAPRYVKEGALGFVHEGGSSGIPSERQFAWISSISSSHPSTGCWSRSGGWIHCSRATQGMWLLTCGSS